MVMVVVAGAKPSLPCLLFTSNVTESAWMQLDPRTWSDMTVMQVMSRSDIKMASIKLQARYRHHESWKAQARPKKPWKDRSQDGYTPYRPILPFFREMPSSRIIWNGHSLRVVTIGTRSCDTDASLAEGWVQLLLLNGSNSE